MSSMEPIELRHGYAGNVSFTEPLPGIGSYTGFQLAPVEGTDDLFSMTVEGAPPGTTPRLFLLDPAQYFLDYAPSIPRDVAVELADADGEEDAINLAVLVVVHPGDDNTGPTANLLAPIVLSPETRRARQVVLEGAPWPLRAPLVAA